VAGFAGALNVQTAITTVTTAQTLGSVVLPAGLMNVAGRTLNFCASGTYTTTGGQTPAITLSAKVAAVTPVSVVSAAVTASAATMPWRFCGSITTAAIGATGTDEAHAALNINLGAGAAAAAVSTYLDTNTAVSSTYDHTAANTLAIQLAAGSTLASATLRQVTWNVVN
jgi:hypothetical protein